MRYKKILSVVLTTVIAVTMIACDKANKVDANAAVTVIETIDDRLGNDFGNLAKGGNLAYKDGYVYYSYLSKLYKKNVKTNEITTLDENGYAISYLNLTRDGIYSIDLGRDNETYIMHRGLNGKEAKILAKEPARDLIVDGKYIYYVGVKDETDNAVIKRMELDGRNKSIFYEPQSPIKFNNFKDNIIMINNYIILQYSDMYKVIDIKISKEKTFLMKDRYMILDYALKDGDLYINVVPIYDYFPNFPFKPILRRINLEKNKDEVLSNEAIYFQILDDGIYYFTMSQIGETDGLYKMDYNGSNKILINKTEQRLAYKANNKIYYIENKTVPDIVEAVNN